MTLADFCARLDYSCSCPEGFGGSTCRIVYCGGIISSQETPLQIEIPDVAANNSIHCDWAISSPSGSRIELLFEELSSPADCSDSLFIIFEGT